MPCWALILAAFLIGILIGGIAMAGPPPKF
jgi:hypothetical protein